MSEAFDRYLDELRNALGASDPAVVQDAIADAEEYLNTALEQAQLENPGISREDAVRSILERYGSPQEVAKAYTEIESRVTVPFAPRKNPVERSPLQRFFGVVAEPRSYAALVYMLVSLVTGIVYFTWAVTGLSISAGMIVLIFGILIFGLFVFSIQGLAFVEGRIVEALLGERMPRRTAKGSTGKGIVGHFLARLKDRRTWTTLLYMIVQLPLGILYFTVTVTLLAYSLELIASPILHAVLRLPLISVDGFYYVPHLWLLPILVIAGILDLVVVLHLARFVGRLHGRWAKALLVQA